MPNLIEDMNRQDLEFTVRRRSQGGQRRPRLGHADHVQRCDVRAGARLPQCAESARDVHAGRQRLDRLRPARQRRVQLARAARALSGACSSPRPSPSAGTAGREVQTAALCRGVNGLVPVRRESPVGARRRHLRHAQRHRIVQQPLRCRAGRRREFAARNHAEHRVAAGHVRRGGGAGRRGDHADLRRPIRVGTSRMGRERRCAIRRPSLARPMACRTAIRNSCRAACRSDRVPPSRGLRARRLALLPDRQAVSRRPRPPARELHARRDVRRQPGERQQRRAVAEGGRLAAQPRGVHLSAADRAGESDAGAGASASRRRSAFRRIFHGPAKAGHYVRVHVR